MNSFNDLDISEGLKNTLKALNFVTPTPIQSQAIPMFFNNEDFIGCAATGTGKTLAFALPTIDKIEKGGKTTLVLCPTRELALQIESVFRQLLGQKSKIRTCVVMGGASMHMQIKNLKLNPQIIIATPGRLADHMNHRTVSLNNIDRLILDEADRMLDMGFAPQIMRIVQRIPKQRQTVLFSATFPKETEGLAHSIMQNPKRITIGQLSKPTQLVTQSVLETTQKQKNDHLLDLLNSSDGSVLIFTRTKRRADRLFTYLNEYGYSVSRIHGDRSQAQRNLAVKGFKDRTFKILVATDIAARGIDVSNVAKIVNYDLPQTGEDYVHRIGRSGRAGIEGQAISLITPEDKQLWRSISRFVQIHKPVNSNVRR